MQTKKELRIWAKAIRKELDMKDISEKILNIFLASSIYRDAQNVCAYYPIETEVQLTPLFQDKTKKYFLPKIAQNENKMDFVEYSEETKINKFNIPEPIGRTVSPSEIDVIILPALLADSKGFRLGYGGGYYDRFLSENKISATKVIFIPEKLIVPNLPTEVFDVPANLLITEKNIIKAQ
ncbi:MAG: 5-formyltetrahydrofolate cyclo-ligase [bacterium]|nr:5-formyltetrahydrofolate cyclo-ligase [bacterium]